jgi:hypothetical protein
MVECALKAMLSEMSNRIDNDDLGRLNCHSLQFLQYWIINLVGGFNKECLEH